MPGCPSQIHCWLWKVKHLNLSYDISKLESGTRSWYQLQVPRENVHSTNINSYVSDISNKVVIDSCSRQVTTVIVPWGKKERFVTLYALFLQKDQRVFKRQTLKLSSLLRFWKTEHRLPFVSFLWLQGAPEPTILIFLGPFNFQPDTHALAFTATFP